MIKVRYTQNRHLIAELTDGKIYEVIKYIPSSLGESFDKVRLINDLGQTYNYYKDNRFTEVTIEYRNKTIDDILS